MPKLGLTWIKGKFPDELKDEYRKYFLKSDIRQARISMAILMIPVLYFIYYDFLYSPGPVALTISLAGRLIFFAYTIILIHTTNRITDYNKYDLHTFLWALFGTIFIAISNLVKPVTYFDGAMVHIIIISIVYFGIPNKFSNWIIIGFLYTAGSLYGIFNLTDVSYTIKLSMIMAVFLVNIAGIFISRLNYYYRRNQFLSHYELEKLASVDALTGIMNRRILLEQLENELKRFQRYRKPFCLIVADIDEFKQVNDNYGHLEGDEVLREFAKTVNGEIRQSDFFGRTGGEEFCIILVETSINTAKLTAERIVRKCRDLEVSTSTGEIIKFSISTGIAEVQDTDNNIDQLLSRADAAMYKAKQEGKDRVIVYRAN
jgi:diguanylate cyclase (GGDEF)-like protein